MTSVNYPSQIFQKIRIIVVTANPRQRMAFIDSIREWGFVLIDCVPALEFSTWHLQQKADVWLIDSAEDYEIIQEIDNYSHDNEAKFVLFGFETAPYLHEIKHYHQWQEKLKRTLIQKLNLPTFSDNSMSKNLKLINRPWQYVILLGASMGGPLAIKEFLDELPHDLPISLLLAQHFDGQMLNTLARTISRHNQWHCEVITKNQTLQSGRCLIVPVDNAIICDSFGKITLKNHGWQDNLGYQPSINQLVKNASDVFGKRLITIIFSGMCDDGSRFAKNIKENHSLIWAQSPESSICDSQPQSVIDTGQVSFIGNPKQLAQQLASLFTQSQNDE